MVCLDEGGRGRRSVRLVATPSNLTPWVEHFWTQDHRDGDRRRWRVVPDASAHLIYSLVDGVPRCAVVGARTSYCDIDLAGRTVTIGARLRPGALFHLVRGGTGNFTDGSFALEDAFGASGSELLARMSSGTAREAVRKMGRFLSARLVRCSGDLPWEGALRQTRSVEGAAEVLDIPARTFRAHVVRATGLTPKRILRIRRLYRALECAAVSHPVWSDIALQTGHADQAHMVREFRDLLGDSPEKWRCRGGWHSADLFNTTGPG